jgi:hypothetical protein
LRAGRVFRRIPQSEFFDPAVIDSVFERRSADQGFLITI